MVEVTTPMKLFLIINHTLRLKCKSFESRKRFLITTDFLVIILKQESLLQTSLLKQETGSGLRPHKKIMIKNYDKKIMIKNYDKKIMIKKL